MSIIEFKAENMHEAFDKIRGIIDEKNLNNEDDNYFYVLIRSFRKNIYVKIGSGLLKEMQ